jgi:sarcosine oxidase subunit delta
MLIPCPCCGERPHSEFVYGGDAAVVRPPEPVAAVADEWLAYLYLRENPRGAHRELWFHELGCGRWLEVTRDTLTHAITGAATPGRVEGSRR